MTRRSGYAPNRILNLPPADVLPARITAAPSGGLVTVQVLVEPWSTSSSADGVDRKAIWLASGGAVGDLVYITRTDYAGPTSDPPAVYVAWPMGGSGGGGGSDPPMTVSAYGGPANGIGSIYAPDGTGWALQAPGYPYEMLGVMVGLDAPIGKRLVGTIASSVPTVTLYDLSNGGSNGDSWTVSLYWYASGAFCQRIGVTAAVSNSGGTLTLSGGSGDAFPTTTGTMVEIGTYGTGTTRWHNLFNALFLRLVDPAGCYMSERDTAGASAKAWALGPEDDGQFVLFSRKYWNITPLSMTYMSASSPLAARILIAPGGPPAVSATIKLTASISGASGAITWTPSTPSQTWTLADWKTAKEIDLYISGGSPQNLTIRFTVDVLNSGGTSTPSLDPKYYASKPPSIALSYVDGTAGPVLFSRMALTVVANNGGTGGTDSYTLTGVGGTKSVTITPPPSIDVGGGGYGKPYTVSATTGGVAISVKACPSAIPGLSPRDLVIAHTIDGSAGPAVHVSVTEPAGNEGTFGWFRCNGRRS